MERGVLRTAQVNKPALTLNNGLGMIEIYAGNNPLAPRMADQDQEGDEGGPLYLSPGRDLLGIYYTSVGTIEEKDDGLRDLFVPMFDEPSLPPGEVGNLTWIRQILAQWDKDKDGIVDTCDKCAGGSEDDSDGDGVPDPCDPCPCSTGGTGCQGDKDCDGVCDNCIPSSHFCVDFCKATKPDLCPNAYDSTNGNHNALAEHRRKATVLGDVCDPVPIGASWFDYKKVGQIPATDKTLCPPPAKLCVEYVELIELQKGGTFTKGSHPGPEATVTTEKAVVGATKFHSYCPDRQSKAGFGPPCTSTEATDNEWLSLPDNEKNPYHALIGNFPQPKGLTWKVGNKVPWTWQWKESYQGWMAGWGQMIPLSLPSPYDESDHGVFRTTANSSVGQTSFDLGTGKHLKLDGTTADALENVYEPLDVATKGGHVAYYLREPILKPGPYLLNEPPRVADVDPALDFGGVQYRWRSGESIPLVTIEGADTDGTRLVGLGINDGGLVVADSFIGTNLMASLKIGTYLEAVEPSSAVGRGEANPPAVVVGPGARGLLDVVRFEGGKLLGAYDRANPPPRGLQSFAKTASVDEPLMVYARSVGRVFSIGSGRPITVGPADPLAERTEIPGDFVPGIVLAATYSYVDRAIWVLHEAAGYAELTRVDPVEGTHQPVRHWPRLRKFDKQWMTLDIDGSVLLSASSDKANRYVVIRIGFGGDGPEVTGVHRGEGRLYAAPRAHQAGYTLAFQRKFKGGLVPDFVRKDALFESQDDDEDHEGHKGWKAFAECL